METGRISEGSGGSPGVLFSGSDKGKSGQFSAENHIAHRASDNHPEAPWRGGFSARFFMDLRDRKRFAWDAPKPAFSGPGKAAAGRDFPQRPNGRKPPRA